MISANTSTIPFSFRQ